MEVGLKTLSEEGLLHMGVVKAPVCNRFPYPIGFVVSIIILIILGR